MVRLSRLLRGVLGLCVVMVLATPASAQTGGMRGKVVDAAGKPVEGASVVIESKGVTRKLTVKTNKKGEFIQIGLYPGEYKVTAEKEGKVAVADNFRVGLGDPSVLDLQLSAGAATTSAEHQKRMSELQAAFDAGVTASKAQNYDEAIASFEKAAAAAPNCHDCYYNIGYAYFQKKDYANAELAYKKATELKPDYVEAWNALANVYNVEKKLDEALAASNKAAELSSAAGPAGATGGGGNAAALFNQGVILWNQQKYAEAKDKFEAATKADPKHAEAQYRLGMSYVNLGDMPKAVGAFEGYLAADPSGPHAEEVKQFISAMKK
jgi:cytochrome c-type biogenesis protein CcmH/NrfG